MKDTLQRFLFENLAVRGEIVHLDATWQAILERHSYPEPVQRVLGELMAAVSLLMATLKFKGQLIAQIQGDGPVKLLVVEGSSDKTLRAMASCKDEQFDDESMQGLFGDARLVITLEPEQGERYQGIVALSGENLAAALTDYLLRSEQLDTDLWLVADEKQCAGLLIQKLPETEKTKSNIIDLESAGESRDLDGWNRIQQLSSTIKDEELLGLSADEIIHRLYHEEDVRLFESELISFRCSCSRERVESMLRSLGADEVQNIIEEHSSIDVACEFCNHNYRFDAVDTEQLFTSNPPHSAPPTEQ
ncbi:MAG: Hsp33 family molecular chaperone HslO [Gammaproteobacteria bacterium]|nr:Hsp33 family molecular chaperone HslO [Gammaproteobacteria bacterium]MCW8988015.1 Hsp33 family molecular chaperone HslO [Gammaproteobacteria bacterium]MCW9031087.1 Hsp33 family molecular chaperone HslO [Gammaproteobacteria bacterium]